MILPNDPEVTIGTALKSLDPTIPRRTLGRILAGLQPVGVEPLKQGGPPCRTYRWSDVVRAHANWAQRNCQDS